MSGVAQKAQREAEKAGKLAAQREAQAQAFQNAGQDRPSGCGAKNLEQQHDELNAAFASGKINGSQFEIIAEKYRKHGESLPGEAQAERSSSKSAVNRLLLCNVTIAQRSCRNCF
ncbi:hypothetical protein MOP93_21070 [Escherichia coli]|uniref:hypothetical protein n=1 Tax=Escherichia coli TaxID=562 RepID=UPI0035B57B9E|nr:hypothetical protein [Escherichia coli]